MHLHILGICGTFMGGIAAIAKAMGHKVTGSDNNVYPPMSTQLESLGIELTQGFDEDQFDPQPDMVVIGNALSRGNLAVEYVLNRGLPIPVARNGYWKTYLMIVGFLRFQVLTAKPVPRVC